MRHFIRYNEEGVLTGCDTRGNGWCDLDPRDAGCSDRIVQLLQVYRSDPNIDFVDWVPFDCPCGGCGPVSCNCAQHILGDHYFNGTVLFPKPSLTIKLNGSEVTLDTVHNYPAESTVSLVLSAAAPDGHETTLGNGAGSFRLLEQETALVFNGGATNAVQLTIPPQGISGFLYGTSKYVRNFQLMLRGWG